MTASKPAHSEPQAGGARRVMERGAVWKELGAPRDQIGSVNDPRTHVECGVKWNEKWVYPRPDGSQRVVLWNRYDLLGVFRIAADGSCQPDPVLEK